MVFGCPKVGHAGVSPSNHARFDGCLAGLRAAGAAAGGATRAAQMGADRCSAERQNAKTSVRALARLPAGERESHGVEVGRGWLVSRRTRSQRNRCALSGPLKAKVRRVVCPSMRSVCRRWGRDPQPVESRLCERVVEVVREGGGGGASGCGG